jgi:hypothetical protein
VNRVDLDTLLGIAIGSLCALALFGAVGLLVLGTILKWRIGINLGGAKCSECGEPAQVPRVPTDTYETMWGGWTCEECGQKNDKWGNPR